MRPAEFGAVRQAVRVPMRDGVRLACQLTRPATNGRPAEGRFPGLVYEVTPYAVLDVFFAEQGDYFAQRGYAAITCTVRGTGQSGGDYPQINQPAEQTDAFDLVEWMATQAWSNGRIGQTGESYGAMSTYRAAAARPPHLLAVAPQQAPNDLYLDDIYPGGIRAQPVLGHWWPLIGQLTSLGRIDASRLFAVQARHPLRDAFWQQIAIDGVLDRVDVPVLAFAGWNDPLFRDGALRNVERLAQLGGEGRTWLIAGPWGHGYVIDWRGCKVIPGCVGSRRVPPGALLAWFDHWVGDRPQAPLPQARVTSYRSGPNAGWRSLDRVDALSSTPPSSFWLAPAGQLTSQPAPRGELRWRASPLDGVAGRVPHLSFVTPPFAGERRLLGRPAVELAMRSSGRDAHLHAALRVVTDAQSKLISEGWLKASHRASHGDVAPLVPGQVYTLRMALEPVDLELPPGARLELRLDSGSATEVQPLPAPVTVAIDTGPGDSVLELPLQ